MHIHEYQAKQLLKEYDVPILAGYVIHTEAEVKSAVKKLGGSIWVVKAQIHAGGRGKGRFKESSNSVGGVRVAKTPKDVVNAFNDMIDKTLITHQSGPEGKQVKHIYIESGCNIQRELYLSIMVDRSVSRIIVMASTEGGMDIESVATETPAKIITAAIDPMLGMQNYIARKMAFALKFRNKQISTFVSLLSTLYRLFTELDCSMLEINPLVVTKAGEIIPLDCKINFDPNALFRHKNIEKMRDKNEEDPAELEALQYGLNYIKLDGTIGCMVNGAGLAMATMDIIKLYGGEPANFLDVGGGATEERVTEAFKIILRDPNVNGVLVNIFGGIMRCDIIAQGIIVAAREVRLDVPLVVRLEGTNADLGKTILTQSDLPIISANDLNDAAEKIVKAVKDAA